MIERLSESSDWFGKEGNSQYQNMALDDSRHKVTNLVGGIIDGQMPRILVLQSVAGCLRKESQ